MGWNKIADRPAPAWERIIVAGWEEPSGGVVGYWWMQEDCADKFGLPYENPHALYWHPMPSTDDLPKGGPR
jgi:hypothetical protein